MGESFQCEGLISPCTIAMAGATDVTVGIPNTIEIGRRRAKESRTIRRMQGEPSVAAYTPLKKDLKIKVPRSPTGKISQKELDPNNGGVIGVAVNGVPIVYEHPGEGANTLLFDSCGGHGDLSNRYHYHLPPVCLLRSLGGTVPRVSDWWLAPNAESQWPSQATSKEKSPLVGWAIDGNPIFGAYNPDNGELVVPSSSSGGDAECSANILDECNGMVLENGVYAYFITPTAPFVPPCLMGDVPTDAFVDGGLLDGMVSQCPFEGTAPLAGTEICDEKAIIFQDESCPGNADRQQIRNSFELATASFVGEPSCDQMQVAIEESASSFLNLGCCQDLASTITEWERLYPSLESCNLVGKNCTIFGDDNVVEYTVELGISERDFVPDTSADIRASLASSLGVKTEAVLVDRVSGSDASTSVRYNVAYATMEEAVAASSLENEADILEDLGDVVIVNSLTAKHALSPTFPPSNVPALWTTGRIVGLTCSLVGLLLFLGVLVFFEDKPVKHVNNTDDKPSGDVPEQSERQSSSLETPVPLVESQSAESC